MLSGDLARLDAGFDLGSGLFSRLEIAFEVQLGSGNAALATRTAYDCRLCYF